MGLPELDQNDETQKPSVDAIAPRVGAVALLEELHAAGFVPELRFDQLMTENGRNFLAQIIEPSAEPEDFTCTVAEGLLIFDKLVAPAYWKAREAGVNRHTYSPDAVERRLGEMRKVLDGASRKGNASNRRAFVGMLKTSGYTPEYFQEALRETLETKVWPDPPEPKLSLSRRPAATSIRQIPVVAHENNAAAQPDSSLTAAANKPKAVSNPGTDAADDILGKPIWENLSDLPETDWHQKVQQATVSWTKEERAGVEALVRNQRAGTEAARQRIAAELAAKVPVRPSRVRQAGDIMSQVSYEALLRLSRIPDGLRERPLKFEDVALQLFDACERDETTVEDAVAEGLLALSRPSNSE